MTSFRLHRLHFALVTKLKIKILFLVFLNLDDARPSNGPWEWKRKKRTLVCMDVCKVCTLCIFSCMIILAHLTLHRVALVSSTLTPRVKFCEWQSHNNPTPRGTWHRRLESTQRQTCFLSRWLMFYLHVSSMSCKQDEVATKTHQTSDTVLHFFIYLLGIRVIALPSSFTPTAGGSRVGDSWIRFSRCEILFFWPPREMSDLGKKAQMKTDCENCINSVEERE